MFKKTLYLSLAFSLLSACSSESNDDPAPDNTNPTVVYTPDDGATLYSGAIIVVQYNEDMDSNSLRFSGDLAGYVGSSVLTGQGNNLKSVVNIRPSTVWSGGDAKTLTIYASDLAGNPAPAIDLNLKVALSFANDTAATVIIGQTSPTLATEPTSATASNVKAPAGNTTLLDDYLYLPDSGQNRVKLYSGIPTGNDDALFFLGQSSDTGSSTGTSNSELNLPGPIVKGLDQYFVVDTENNRVMVFDEPPVSSGAIADDVLGQSGFDTIDIDPCQKNRLNAPTMITVANNRLIVADSANNRIVAWTLPITTITRALPSLLGQANWTSCDANRGSTVDSNTLNNPTAVLSDGSQFLISDTGNHRVLGWLDFPILEIPEISILIPKFVLGQKDFKSADINGETGTVNASSFNAPSSGMSFSGSQICITDSGNNRVLIWNGIPNEATEPLMVLGQASMLAGTPATTAKGLRNPTGCTFVNNQLIVTDTDNHRAVIYNSL